MANAVVQLLHDFLQFCKEEAHEIHYAHVDYGLGEKYGDPRFPKKTWIMKLTNQVKGKHLSKFIIAWLVVFVLLYLILLNSR